MKEEVFRVTHIQSVLYMWEELQKQNSFKVYTDIQSEIILTDLSERVVNIIDTDDQIKLCMGEVYVVGSVSMQYNDYRNFIKTGER